MVLQVMKWDIHPDKRDAYVKWIDSGIKRTTGAPGVVEFRAYRVAAGSSQIVVTFEFADMAAWAAWQGHADVQKALAELHSLAINVSVELWGTSPVTPTPIRPGK